MVNESRCWVEDRRPWYISHTTCGTHCSCRLIPHLRLWQVANSTSTECFFSTPIVWVRCGVQHTAAGTCSAGACIRNHGWRADSLRNTSISSIDCSPRACQGASKIVDMLVALQHVAQFCASKHGTCDFGEFVLRVPRCVHAFLGRPRCYIWTLCLYNIYHICSTQVY